MDLLQRHLLAIVIHIGSGTCSHHPIGSERVNERFLFNYENV